MSFVNTPADRAAQIGRLMEASDFNIQDLLIDLRHYCDANDLDFAAEDKIAYRVYSLEAKEGRNATPRHHTPETNVKASEQREAERAQRKAHPPGKQARQVAGQNASSHARV